MIQQGQVFKLKATSVDGEPLWAYRYRVAGRDSARRQAGGFTTKAGAQRALQNRLARLLPGGRAGTLTLAEWVEEYLDAHQGERVTIAKLRWLLGKATAALGEVRLAELSPDQVSAWRLTVPEGHRFEATQALRQVLNRAVNWKLIDDNPAKRVPNPARRCREQRPFDSWQQIRSLAEQLGPAHGPMVLFAAATGLRPSELFALERRDVDRAAGVVRVRRAYANGRVKHTKTRLSRRAVPRRESRSRRSTSYGRGRTVRCSSRTPTAATLTSATSTGATGSPSRRRPESTRCAISTTCATRTPPSPSAPASPCSPCRDSWARASQ
jgi:integrase